LWLKLTGGKGMGAMVGGFVTIIPLYGHLKELGVFLGIILIVVAITRNVALSNGVALVGLPFICWLSIHSATFVIWSIALGLIIAAKFLPTALRALAKDSNIKHYIKGS
jgi:glycerol-3-phosphate acyltransferase PlsY